MNLACLPILFPLIFKKCSLTKRRQWTGTEEINLDIRDSEFVAILGPSGCGKTTLLRMIAGFNSIEGGTIKFDEKVINDISAHKRNIGMVFQNYAIFPHMTVEENVEYGLKIRNLSSVISMISNF
jgi:iron(III) transport system ATP-binding protein